INKKKEKKNPCRERETHLLKRIRQTFCISLSSRAQSIGPMLAGTALHTQGQQEESSQEFGSGLHSKELQTAKRYLLQTSSVLCAHTATGDTKRPQAQGLQQFYTFFGEGRDPLHTS
uniref:Uncharacterized protein n=1 Tax=Marmota marmota marmota TaxID=9994 RepID=A0A8C6ETU1_MARMA